MLKPPIPSGNCGGTRDKALAFAYQIQTEAAWTHTRITLQGLLCARDISLEGIAMKLGLELDVVKLYEGLFFNVRNREGAFAINTIFPQTRLGAVRELNWTTMKWI